MKPSLVLSLLLSSALLHFIAVPAGATTVNWPNQGFSSGINGYNRLETTISTSNAATLTLSWQSSTTDINGVYGLVESGGMIFVESNDATGTADVVALNGSTGAEVWKASLNTSDSTFGALYGIAAGSGLVFSPCVNTNVPEGICAFSQKTGKLVWADSLYAQGVADGGPLERPTFAAGVLYVSSSMCDLHVPACNDVYAMNARTGAIIWSAQPPASGFSENGWNASPAVLGSVMYAPCSYVFNGNAEDVFNGLCTFSTSNGIPGWQYGLENDGGLFNMTVGVSVVGTTAFLQEYDPNTGGGALTALNTGSGSALWSFTQGAFGPHDGVQPTVARGKVYWPDANGTLWALQGKTGTTLWSTSNWGQFCNPTAGTESQPQFIHGVVFITTGCQNGGERYVATFALDASSGSTLWSDAEGFNVIPIQSSGAAPVIVNGELYADCVNVCAYKPAGVVHPR